MGTTMHERQPSPVGAGLKPARVLDSNMHRLPSGTRAGFKPAPTMLGESFFHSRVEYVELHCHSCYSLREGASTPRELIDRARELKYPALALTDHDNLYGAMEFSHEADTAKFKAINGAEITLSGGHHLTLLVRDGTGWSNLCQLLSHAYLDTNTKDEPRLDAELLPRYAAGLTALSGCKHGEVPGLLDAGQLDEAQAVAGRYREWFGEHYWLELQQNFVDGDRQRITRLVALAEQLSIPYVATNNVHYHVEERARLQDVLVAIRYRTTLQASHKYRRANSDFYLKSPAQMAHIFRELPLAIRNTVVISEQCGFNLFKEVPYEFPDFQIPEVIHEPYKKHYEQALEKLLEESTPASVAPAAGPIPNPQDCHPERSEGPEVRSVHQQCPEGHDDFPPSVRQGGPAEPCRGGFKTRPCSRSNMQDMPSVECGQVVNLPLQGDIPSSALHHERIVVLPEPRTTGTWTPPPDPREFVPDPWPLMPGAGNPQGDAFLEALCRAAKDRRFPADHPHHQAAEERLAEELRLIRKHGLSGFFLAYYQLLHVAGEIAHELRGRNPDLPPDVRPIARGRGSSVASLVCYLIGLSHIDPIANNLSLTRFMNEELASVPDIDLDLPRDIRADLLARIWTFFDQDRAALVCSFATYRLRSAIRDVGKVLDLPAAELDKLAKLSDMWGSGSVAAEMARVPEFASKLDAPIWRDLVDLSAQLSGMPRHIGQHVGGIVLSRESLKKSVPIEPARWEGRYVIQWDKDSVDDARMVKIDLLGLGMLSLVDDCLSMIERRCGTAPDLGRIDHDDQAVYDTICKADTVGLFQIESRAQISSLRTTQPRNLEELAIQVALIRPGPIMAGAFHPFMEMRRRAVRGEPVDIEYAHPCLESVLKETLGVVIFQDQVLQIAMVAAGYTPGEGERLRRAMSRRRSEEVMNKEWPRFLYGCHKTHGITEEVAAKIFRQLLAFAAFGFPKSHSVAFALLAYESAWLRFYYPAEYLAALLNAQPMGFYRPHVLVGDAQRHGLTVHPPAVNASGAQCVVESKKSIRLGLNSVSSVGLDLARAAVMERDQHGSFTSLFDFAQRTLLKHDQIEALIMGRAFEEFGLRPRELLWQLGLFFAPRPHGQLQLDLPTEQDMVRLPGLNNWERLQEDYNQLGLSLNLHPLALLRPKLAGLATSRDLARMKQGQQVVLAGLIVCRQRPSTASGLVFELFEDEFGMANVVIYNDLFDRERETIRLAPLAKVFGEVQWRGGNVNILASHFEAIPMQTVAAPDARNFH